MSLSIEMVARALHPLDAPPCEVGWNREEILDLLGAAPRTPAAVLIGLRDIPQPTVIFTVRHENLRTHAGQVSFPGGRIDDDDANAIAAALRESSEEIGLDPRDAQPLGFLDGMETISGYCVTPVVARISAGARIAPRSNEVSGVFEMPLAFLLDPTNLRKREIILPPPLAGEGWGGWQHAITSLKRRSVYEYMDTQPLIWGATAAMLVNLMRRMQLV